MKTTLLVSLAMATAICCAQAQDTKPGKSQEEKAASTFERTGEKVKKDAVLGAKPDKDAREVPVKLAEGRIDMPKSLAPGKTDFVVTNKGKQKHNFEITGKGVDETFMLDLAPNETKTLHVDLKPGSYQIACPVLDHNEADMKLTLTVK